MARLSASKRGYDHKWREQIRPAALAREPLCRFCKANGRVVRAAEVDHIDGDSRNNRPDNLRSLCKPCHSARTARDQSFGGTGSRFPKGLKSAGAQVILVAGPPLAGKSTFMREEAGPGDVIVDWDSVAHATFRKPVAALTPDRYPALIMSRQRILIEALTRQSGVIYLEDRAPLLWQRRHWAIELGARSVVLETPPEVCTGRAIAGMPPDAARRAEEAASQWWQDYTVDYTDRRIA